MPILHANMQADLREASRLDQGLRVSLIDMASIRQVPGGALDYLGTVNGALSDTGLVRFWEGGGADTFALTLAEDTTQAETAIVDSSVAVAVVRHALVRNIGDLADLTGSAGDISPESLAADAVLGNERTFTNSFMTALATAATDVGTSGSDMVHDDFADALYTLEIADNPSGPVFCALAGRSLADWQESLRAEGGALHLLPATGDMLRFKGQGFAGEMLGVQVWKFSHVVDDTTDFQNGMWTAGAFGYKIGIPNNPRGGSAVAVRMDELMVEYQRDADQALTKIAANSWYGVSLLEQARVVGIVTDN